MRPPAPRDISPHRALAGRGAEALRISLVLVGLTLLVPVGASVWPIGILSGGPCGIGDPGGEAFLSQDFETGMDDWSLASTAGRPNLWHLTTFAGNGSADDQFHGGPGRMYYGVENEHGGTYNTSRMRNQGELRSPPFVVPSGTVAVALNTKWHVEWDRPAIIDSMQLGVVRAGFPREMLCTFGNQWAGHSNMVIGYGYYQNSPSGQAIMTACEYALETPHNPCRVTQDYAGVNANFDLAPVTTMWEPRFVLLPSDLAGQTIQVSFYFQTGDAIVDDAMGWMVDDVRVVSLG